MQTKDQQYIEFNQNFNQTIYIRPKQTPLSPSPMPGVQRMILERRGDEVARRATSVVTYQPNSSFSAHIHHYGQEFFVLQGTFSDHSGDFTKGWYVRNPVKSSHAPFSKEGTRIFVKLGQMPLSQTEHLRLDTNILDYSLVIPGVSKLVLYQSAFELVYLYKLEKGTVFQNDKNQEISQIFVIDGIIIVEGVELQTQSWIRIPKQKPYSITSMQNSKIYIKIGKGIVRDKQWKQISFD